MSSSASCNDQQIVRALAIEPEALRGMSPGEMLVSWARRILETADLSRGERQNLHDVCRAHRAAAIDRSAFGVLARYAPRAPLAANVWGTNLICAELVSRARYEMLPPVAAHEHEERANHGTNAAQLRHLERRTRSSLHDLTDWTGQQAAASKMLALSEAAHLHARSSIVLASR